MAACPSQKYPVCCTTFYKPKHRRGGVTLNCQIFKNQNMKYSKLISLISAVPTFLFSQDVIAPKVRQKQMVRLSWEIAKNAEFYDSKLTSFGFGGMGQSFALDLGLPLYKKNDLEFGLQFTPLNWSNHKFASNLDLGNQIVDEMNKYTNSNNWYVDSVFSDVGVNTTNSVAIGVYAVKNTPIASIKAGLQVGSMLIGRSSGFNGSSGGHGPYSRATLGSYFPVSDFLEIKSSTKFKTRAYINPSISFLIGKPKAKVRLSINMGYKSMWFTACTGGWIQGTMYGGTPFSKFSEITIDIRRTGIFNFGIGISGF